MLTGMQGLVFKDARYGAYTELFAGLSPDVTSARTKDFIMPWGRFAGMPDDIEVGMRSKEDGGNGLLAKFVEYCDKETKAFR